MKQAGNKFSIFNSQFSISSNPLFEKYYGWSPYQCSLNNPIGLKDMTGFAPGDVFKTRNEAAHDFGMSYNGLSIKNKIEYNTSIYSFKQDGKTLYSYSEPNEGTDSWSSPSTNPDGTKREGTAHTHGNYDPNVPNPKGANEVSNTDTYNAMYSFKVPVYVATPDGSMWFYDPKTNKEPRRISTDLPSDNNDPNQKNKNGVNDSQGNNDKKNEVPLKEDDPKK